MPYHFIREFIRVRYIQAIKFAYLLLSRKRSARHRFTNILFLRKDGIGDAVMFLPSFKAIKRKFPSSEINLVNFKAFDEVLWAEKDVNVIRRPLRYLLSCVLEKKQFDEIVIFSGGREIKLLRYMQKYRNISVLENTAIFPGEHHVDFYFRLSGSIFGKLPDLDRNPSLVLTDDEKRRGRDVLATAKLENCKKIGIVVGAMFFWKRYPYCEELVEWIKSDIELMEYTICLFGGKNGIGEAINLRNKYPDTVDFTKLTLREAMAVASHMDLIICTDSGFMHVANALYVKTLAIFGPTDARCLIKGSTRNRVLAVAVPLECSPCYRAEKTFSCGNAMKCMNIPANMIVAIAKMVLRDEVNFGEPLIMIEK